MYEAFIFKHRLNLISYAYPDNKKNMKIEKKTTNQI